MTREELCIRACKYAIGELTRKGSVAFITAEHESKQQISWVEVVEWLNALKQEPCEMTVEEYRQRMIQAFHNADTDGLIAICALPTEKGFEHLEWLLKNYYKKEPCDNAINRQAVLDALDEHRYSNEFCEEHHIDQSINLGMAHIAVNELPPVIPQPKIGRWVENDRGISICSCCGKDKYEDIDGSIYDDVWFSNYCPNCGAKMQGVKE